ncbi:hypothetical protein F2Q70_00035126 [Brassica cretica]|uniref:Uncharacterized protein n=1 Tax=Brassica cretica TaxID=69181 RepID=A0A8S9JVL4_BRACR|nr:hypothetical protein F2Q70_00035126 [Brassica cretica]
MEDESPRWFSSMSERRWLSSRKNLRYSPRQIISVAVVVDSRWLPSTNLGGYPRRITVAIVDWENLWLSPTIRSGGGLISSLKKSKDTAPPNSPISLYSPSSSFSSLATPGIWSKRSVKSKLVRKTFVVSKGIKKEPKQVSGEILSFFTRKNFNVYSSWRNNYASKGRGKKTTFEGKGLSEFQTMWSIKQQDLVMKERLSKMSLLDSLIGKKEPLSEAEEALKKKASCSCSDDGLRKHQYFVDVTFIQVRRDLEANACILVCHEKNHGQQRRGSRGSKSQEFCMLVCHGLLLNSHV